MIKIEDVDVYGIEPAIKGMRNPMNSWDKTDSVFRPDGSVIVGQADRALALKLAKNGRVHAKYRRMISVYANITAPLYWWKEFDTYKVGTVSNSCSTMHKLAERDLTIDDFSTEHLIGFDPEWVEPSGFVDTTKYPLVLIGCDDVLSPEGVLSTTIRLINTCRKLYVNTKEKRYWWQMIQLLPSSYNQRRTVMMNYEVLANIYEHRRDHKLDEWRSFCSWVESLPNSELITVGHKVITPGENDI